MHKLSSLLKTTLALVLSLVLVTGLSVPASATRHYAASGTYQVTLEDNNALDKAVADEILNIFKTTYPEMAARFNKNAPKYVQCIVDPNYDGVAYTTKWDGVTTVVFSADWFKNNPADTDCATHEFMHCVQDYQWGTAMWLVEGIADYARNEFGLYNDKSYWALGDYSPDQNYDNAYRVTGRFLLWCERYIDEKIVEKMDDYLYSGQYTDECWVTETGRTVQELWTSYSSDPSITRIHGDVDSSGAVDVGDIMAVKSAIMREESNWKMDVSMDNRVMVDDIVILKSLIMKG